MLGATGSSEPKGDDDLHLVENLRYLRKMKGKLQQEIAIQLGVDQKTISSWERGTRTPTIEAIIKLARSGLERNETTSTGICTQHRISAEKTRHDTTGNCRIAWRFQNYFAQV